MTPAREEDVLLPLGDGYLWTVLHHPAGEEEREQAGAARTGVVVCSPFGAEKVKAHRTLVAVARQLARQGFAVARFDHRGEGDSSGDFDQFALLDRLDDVDAVVGLLAARCGVTRWGGIGLRLGATILAVAAARRPDRPCPPLCLWAPVAEASGYLRELLRANVVEQGARHGRVLRDREALLAALAQGEVVQVDGFPLRWPLFAEAGQLGLAAALGRLGSPPLPVLLLDLVRGGKSAPAAALVTLAQPSGAGVELLRCSSSFWQDFRYHRPLEQELLDRTCVFFARELAGDG